MSKNIEYHEDVVAYNRRLAEVAEQLAEELNDETVKKWCAAVGRQHRAHERRHAGYIQKLKHEDENQRLDEIIEEVRA